MNQKTFPSRWASALVLGTSLSAFSVLLAGAAPAPEAPKPKLRWAPPQLEKPITLEIGQGRVSKNLKADRDYIINLPDEKQIGGVALKGGRNIILMGGEIAVPPGDQQSLQRGIYIKDATGTVHIEGVKIDNSEGAEFDGIAIAAPAAIVQIQNVRIIGLSGSQKTVHADVLQPWGGAKEIRVDRLTGTSNYQGFQIPPDRAPIGSADLRHINLGHIQPPTGRPGYLLWLTTGNKGCNTYPMSFSEVYVEPRKNEKVGTSVWPSTRSNNTPLDACLAVAEGDTVSWPKLPYKGVVKQGPPADGDFVPDTVAGLHYATPGYEPAETP